jgi:hypothetical protein
MAIGKAVIITLTPFPLANIYSSKPPAHPHPLPPLPSNFCHPPKLPNGHSHTININCFWNWLAPMKKDQGY